MPLYNARREQLNDPFALERYLIRERVLFMNLISKHIELCASLKYDLTKKNKFGHLEKQYDAVVHPELCETFDEWKDLVNNLLKC